MEGKKWNTEAWEGFDRNMCVCASASQYMRRGERQTDRQTSRVADVVPTNVFHFKRSIPVKMYLTVSAPQFATTPYSLVLVTPLMVSNYCLSEELFLYIQSQPAVGSLHSNSQADVGKSFLLLFISNAFFSSTFVLKT